jgi:hypothetical protein
MKDEENINFKVLRVSDPSVIGGSKKLEARVEPACVHFPNAKGGLRDATISEIRACAAASAQRTIKRFAKV